MIHCNKEGFQIALLMQRKRYQTDSYDQERKIHPLETIECSPRKMFYIQRNNKKSSHYKPLAFYGVTRKYENNQLNAS